MNKIATVQLNTISNTELLTKYLIKIYGQNKAKELLITYKSNLFGKNGLAFLVGKNNLEFFCMYFLQDVYTGDDKAELASIHHEVWDEAQDMILHTNGTKHCYILPRGTGKTTCITLPVAIWCAVYNYSIYTVISSSISATAEQFIANIKVALENNPYIESAFGQLIDKKLKYNSEQIELDTKPSKTMIQSISATSSFRGRTYANHRIELMLLDDFQNESELLSEDMRNRKITRFNNDAKMALQKSNNHVIALGTLQMKGDVYDYFRSSPTWKTRVEKGVLMDDIDTYFNSGLWLEFKKILLDKSNEYALDYAKEFYLQNKEEMQFPMLWSEYWSCLDISLSYFESPVSFKQEFQNDIDHVGEKLFKSIITKSAAEIEDNSFAKTILSCDPAGTNRISKKRDYYAFCVLSTTDKGVKYARKSIIKDFEMDDYISLTLDLLRQYTDITHLSVEKNVYSGADVIKLKEEIAKDIELRGRDLTIINKSRTSNKDNRISAIVGDVNMGRVIFNEEDTEAIEQLQDFCGTKYSLHDDFPDCLADAIENISTIENIPKMKVFPLSFLGL